MTILRMKLIDVALPLPKIKDSWAPAEMLQHMGTEAPSRCVRAAKGIESWA